MKYPWKEHPGGIEASYRVSSFSLALSLNKIIILFIQFGMVKGETLRIVDLGNIKNIGVNHILLYKGDFIKRQYWHGHKGQIKTRNHLIDNFNITNLQIN